MKNFYRKFRWLLPMMLLLLPFFIKAQTNQYLHFDKVDDYCKLDNASQYIANSTAISMTGWFYCDELSYGQGMMGLRGTDAGFYLIQLNNGVVECRFITATGFFEFVAPANSTVPQVWQHWAWIYDGSTVKLYIDGIMKGSVAANGSINTSTVSFGIGKSIIGSFNFVYGGRIDEVTLWNNALTQNEILDMMDNELSGNEAGLQLYYKFNQGVPGGNNTSITQLISETGGGARDADLFNFALVGETSNFGGDLNPGFQAITFPPIPNKLTSSPPFALEASASSGLPVTFQIVSGPATLNGNMVTLTGVPGEVTVKASQPGNGTFDPAEDLFNTFQVIDPQQNVPDIEARNPLPGNVYVPDLDFIQLAAISTIEYPELFSISNLVFVVNGQTIEPEYWGDGHFIAWWSPPAYGNYTVSIVSTNNFGAAATENVNINVVAQASDMQVLAVNDVWLNVDINSVTIDGELPSFCGAFDQITATLQVSCPSGGCGEWDRVASIDARGKDGKWFEIIRYITPYGVPCSHSIDLTDYASILQGKVSFRLNCATLDNGYLYDLTFFYKAGTPAHKYSSVSRLWNEIYPFGDPANLQPVENIDFSFPSNAAAATLKVVSTGHGWGDNNTGNAAEFHHDIHHIWVNGQQTFTQDNWQDCQPNPDACQPQNGTWFYDRAGWCPGAIAHWFDFNMTPYVTNQNVELGYIFDEDYVDLCHPNNPDCVTGVTCPDCNDGFNPNLVVASNLVVFADSPVENAFIVGVNNGPVKSPTSFNVAPNPTNGIVEVSVKNSAKASDATLQVYNMTGKLMQQIEWNGQSTTVDLSSYNKGMYLFKMQSDNKVEIKKVVLK